jgi:hypothetical protein
VSSQTAGGAAAGPKGGTSKQTSNGVDIRTLEDDNSDAPMKLPTASRELRVAIAQARTVRRGERGGQEERRDAGGLDLHGNQLQGV